MIKILDPMGNPVKTLARYKELDGDVMVFEAEKADSYRVKAWRSKTGHVEATAVRQLAWTEVDIDPKKIRRMLKRAENDAKCPIEIEKKKRAALVASCRRAKKRVRQLCKASGMDTLLTLTYRALVADLGVAKRHLKEFHRRMVRVFPDFRFVAAFELQKRGAWHMHLATQRVPDSLPASNGVMVKSFNVIRAVWRSVTKEAEGNIDVQRRKRNSSRSAAGIANYIAKYIAKDFETADKWVNRYAAYGVQVIEADELDGVVSNLHEAIEFVFGCVAAGDRVQFVKLMHYKDVCCLHAEPPG